MTEKVLAYITRVRGGRVELLTFTERAHPEAGRQVPAGTVRLMNTSKSWARHRIDGFILFEGQVKIPGWSLNILGCRSMQHSISREIKTGGWRRSPISTSAEEPALRSGRAEPVRGDTQTPPGALATA